MRFLGIGECADLSDLYLRLNADGHEVKVFIGERRHHVLAPWQERVLRWRRIGAGDDAGLAQCSQRVSQAQRRPKRVGIGMLMRQDRDAPRGHDQCPARLRRSRVDPGGEEPCQRLLLRAVWPLYPRGW